MPWIAANHKKLQERRRRFGVDRRPGEANLELPPLADYQIIDAAPNSESRCGRSESSFKPRDGFLARIAVLDTSGSARMTQKRMRFLQEFQRFQDKI
jgi:hypothetical protein